MWVVACGGVLLVRSAVREHARDVEWRAVQVLLVSSVVGGLASGGEWRVGLVLLMSIDERGACRWWRFVRSCVVQQ
jgi:hypothetical protein